MEVKDLKLSSLTEEETLAIKLQTFSKRIFSRIFMSKIAHLSSSSIDDYCGENEMKEFDSFF
ncbi:hypothetical protein DERP_005384 [Dermatophagoides pteronyssinus]|uniref:Uncharacterized protein n=1 Tax=Dermatophagoides pteronyssinus TaxID=6956 RepID=A0ABQ8JMG4_DERPT|nr:hypothetical protein DERP_005384 [Dermatophagoides pteronyssinus]